MCAKHYKNPTKFSKVTAKNVGMFFETHCRSSKWEQREQRRTIIVKHLYQIWAKWNNPTLSWRLFQYRPTYRGGIITYKLCPWFNMRVSFVLSNAYRSWSTPSLLNVHTCTMLATWKCSTSAEVVSTQMFSNRRISVWYHSWPLLTSKWAMATDS